MQYTDLNLTCAARQIISGVLEIALQSLHKNQLIYINERLT